MGIPRLLACFAHPDDEAFPVGGALATLAARGVEIRLICATSGEEGEIRQPGSATPESLPQVRLQELESSCKALGIQAPVLLGYRDSGMFGTSANNHVLAFINVPNQEVTERITMEIRSFRPQVVLTFEPGGLYGHPDHIAICQHATAAFNMSGDPKAYLHHLNAGLKPYSPSRLFYSARPRGFRTYMAQRLQEAGIDTPLPSPERRDDGVPPEDIHIVLNVSDHVDKKIKSIRCHFTQLAPDRANWEVPHQVAVDVLGWEHYIRGFPIVEPGSTIPDDFFHGIEYPD